MYHWLALSTVGRAVVSSYGDNPPLSAVVVRNMVLGVLSIGLTALIGFTGFLTNKVFEDDTKIVHLEDGQHRLEDAQKQMADVASRIDAHLASVDDHYVTLAIQSETAKGADAATSARVERNKDAIEQLRSDYLRDRADLAARVMDVEKTFASLRDIRGK